MEAAAAVGAAALPSVPVNDILFWHTHGLVKELRFEGPFIMHPEPLNEKTKGMQALVQRINGDQKHVHGWPLLALAGCLPIKTWNSELRSMYGFGREIQMKQHLWSCLGWANEDAFDRAVNGDADHERLAVMAYRLSCLMHWLHQNCVALRFNQLIDADQANLREKLHQLLTAPTGLGDECRLITCIGEEKQKRGAVLIEDTASKPHCGKYAWLTLGYAMASDLPSSQHNDSRRKVVRIRAHRLVGFALKFAYKLTDRKMLVLHEPEANCFQAGQCINPEHLYIGTHKDNVRDQKRKRKHDVHGQQQEQQQQQQQLP